VGCRRIEVSNAVVVSIFRHGTARAVPTEPLPDDARLVDVLHGPERTLLLFRAESWVGGTGWRDSPALSTTWNRRTDHELVARLRIAAEREPSHVATLVSEAADALEGA
jgi:hypothetical protein